MKKLCKRAVSWTSAVTLVLTMIAMCGLTLPVAADTVLFSENFDSYANGTLPSNWTISSDSGYTDITVQDGALVINGLGTDAQTRVVYVGPELINKSDYCFEADYTIIHSDTALTSSTRYSAMMFRAQSDIYPYYYVTTRVRPGTNNELSIRNNSSTSSYQQIALAAPPAQQVIGTTYHLKVVCRGATIQYFIDDSLIFNTTLDTTGSSYSYLAAGTIGFTTSNLHVRFDNITVTEVNSTVAVQPAAYDTYIPSTDLINPPAVISDVTSESVYNSMTGTKLPASSIYYINDNLEVTTPAGEKITTLANALNFTDGKVIPALYVKDKATVDALYDFVVESALQDAYLVSDDAVVLKYAREKYVNFYGVLYKKLTSAATEQDLRDMVADTNVALGKTVMVDGDYLSKYDVDYLQKRLMNVWVISDTDVEDYNNIAKGVNGIVTGDHGRTLYVMESGFSTGTPMLVRQPYMFAHRGYSSAAPQNTIPAFEAAAANGADHVEMDVRLTSDGHVVLYHDEYLYTLTDCADTTKTVENTTLAELMTYTVDEQINTTGITSKIVTLEEFLTFLAGTDIIGIVEIKNYQKELVSATTKMIKDMGMEHQVVSICFGNTYCNQFREELPEVSVGWLANANTNYTTPASILTYAKGYIMGHNLSYHPNYGQISSNWGTVMVENVVPFMAQRGLAPNPWTYNDQNAFNTAYINGVQGLTTDYLEYGNTNARSITAGNVYNMAEGVATDITALVKTGTSHSITNVIVRRTGGAAVTFTNNADGTVTASGTGAATAMLLYKDTIGSNEYYVFSELVTMNVTSSGGVNVTENYYASLLPKYTAGWTNYMTDMNIDVIRAGGVDTLVNTSGGYPAVKNTNLSYTTSVNSEIAYDVTVDNCASFIIVLSDGSSYQLQRYMSGVSLSGEDLVGNGNRFVGTLKLSDIVGKTSGTVTITSFNVFNVGNEGDEVAIRQFDLVEQVPAQAGLRGDLDKDGSISTKDVRLLLDAAVGVGTFNYLEKIVADYNYDDSADSSDARAILLEIVG